MFVGRKRGHVTKLFHVSVSNPESKNCNSEVFELKKAYISRYFTFGFDKIILADLWEANLLIQIVVWGYIFIAASPFPLPRVWWET
jgi:hypothetical protein